MSIHEVVVPDVGDSRDVEVSELLVAPGAQVAVGDALLVLESDKASVEVTAEIAGTVAEFAAAPGDKVVQGQVLVRIETGATAAPVVAAPAPPPVAAAAPPQVAAAAPPQVATPAPPPVAAAPPAATSTASAAPAATPAAAASELEVKVPDVGDAKNVVVSELLANVGDTVKAGQALVVLESDKASMEIEASADGVLLRYGVRSGDEVAEGAVIAVLSVLAAAVASAPPPAVAQAPAVAAAAPPAHTANAATPPVTAPSLSEAVVTAAAAAVYAGPAVRKFARELGVDLGQVTATGPRGRMLKDDVNSYVKRRLTAAPSATVSAEAGTGIPPIPTVDFTKFGAIEELKLPRIQRAGGVNLHRSWLNLPHVTHFDEADITDLEVFRKSIKDDAQKAGARVTPLAFLIKACARALIEFPKFNCSLGPNKDTLILKRYYNIGVAVDTDNGLVVPVVKGVDRKGVYELAREVVDLSERARAGKLKPEEMSGGTFSISSLGVLGGTGFTPIINAPEVAILGVAKLATKPVWNGSAFVPRELLPLCLSYDHRVINGADAARFTSYLMGLLADMRKLML